MTERRRCPGCGTVVSVPDGLGDMAVGCQNVDQHDEEDGPLVMWPVDDDLDDAPDRTEAMPDE